MSEFMNAVDIPCPFCGKPIPATVEWTAEYGEFGTLLSEWPKIESLDLSDHSCLDFSRPLFFTILDWWNDPDRLHDLLFPEPLDSDDDSEFNEKTLLQMISEAEPEGLPFNPFLEDVRRHDQPEVVETIEIVGGYPSYPPEGNDESEDEGQIHP